MPCNLILVGYRCCGKTSVGKLLADLLSYDFVDTDICIESECRSSIDELVADKGWPYFRQKETQTLAQVLQGNNQVIATGGGMVLAPENRALMKTRGFVIWLAADGSTIVRRLEADPGPGPPGLGSLPDLWRMKPEMSWPNESHFIKTWRT